MHTLSLALAEGLLSAAVAGAMGIYFSARETPPPTTREREFTNVLNQLQWAFVSTQTTPKLGFNLVRVRPVVDGLSLEA